jgi:hypothetical protein
MRRNVPPPPDGRIRRVMVVDVAHISAGLFPRLSEQAGPEQSNRKCRRRRASRRGITVDLQVSRAGCRWGHNCFAGENPNRKASIEHFADSETLVKSYASRAGGQEVRSWAIGHASELLNYRRATLIRNKQFCGVRGQVTGATAIPRSHRPVHLGCIYDENYGRSCISARLAVELGDKTYLSLFGTQPENHRLPADHLTAAYPITKTGIGRDLSQLRRSPSSV